MGGGSRGGRGRRRRRRSRNTKKEQILALRLVLTMLFVICYVHYLILSERCRIVKVKASSHPPLLPARASKKGKKFSTEKLRGCS